MLPTLLAGGTGKLFFIKNVTRKTGKESHQTKPVLGIYEVNGDELKICLRHGLSAGGRPSEFSSKPDTSLILIVFKRAKAK